jgi:hypothetical protein
MAPRAAKLRRQRAGLSTDVYARLLAAYRVKPGEHTHAARLAGCSPNTAQKAWERGLREPFEARVPIREQLKGTGAPASPPPLKPQPDGACPELPLAELEARVNKVRYEGLLVGDRARASCLILNDAFGMLAPGLYQVAQRAEGSLAELLKKPKDKDPKKEAASCLGILKLGAQIGRAVSLITKSTSEADRALVESLRVPFTVAPKPEQPLAAGGEDEADLDAGDEDLERALERNQAALLRIKARRSREAAAPAPASPEASPPAPSSPSVPLDGSQADTLPSAGPAPHPEPTLDATRRALLDELGAPVVGAVTAVASAPGLSLDAIVRGVLGLPVPGVDGEDLTAAVMGLDDVTMTAVMGLAGRWPTRE